MQKQIIMVLAAVLPMHLGESVPDELKIIHELLVDLVTHDRTAVGSIVKERAPKIIAFLINPSTLYARVRF